MQDLTIDEKLGGSTNMKAVYNFLKLRGDRGATTLEIAEYCNTCAAGSTVADLRKKGFVVDCKYQFMNKNKKRVFRYWLG